MKKLFKTLSLIGLSLSLGLNAQTSSNKTKSQTNPTAPQNDAKSAYISNQDYLSANSMSGYKNYYGDSLKGFDEAKIKTDLLARGLMGWEAQIHIHKLKRDFINDKYNIGQRPNYLPPLIYQGKGSTSSTSGGKTIGGGGNTINVAPCVNEDFEANAPGAYTASTAVTGWTVTSRNSSDGSCSPSNWTAGSPEFSLVATPLLNWGSVGGVIGVIPNSPLGGTVVAQLNDHNNNYMTTRLTQQFPVTSANTLFQFAYAGYWQDGGGGHSCCPTAANQPGIGVRMYDCNGVLLTCSSLSISPGANCQSNNVTFTVQGNTASWSNWQVKYIDLTPYIGTCVTMEIITLDCSFGGHWGSTLFDAKCGGQLIGSGLGGSGGNIGGPVSFCSGSNQAQIAAPVGYSTYQWYGPSGPIAAPQGTMATLTISNPLPGTVYTVQMVAASGCTFTSTNAILTSTVTIAGIGTSSTCIGGASGSATVIGNGSGTGYNYTWFNAATSAVVGTTQVVGNLAPGVYSVLVTGFGAAGCGSAVATTTVSTAPPGITQYLKPFCNNEAYLAVPIPGTNYQWYNALSPIAGSLGGTQSSYTVNAPVNQSVYWLSYLSSQGCQDSIKFTLISSQPGLISVSSISICPNANNGVNQINLSPAPGAPPGLNSYSVFSTGTTSAYSSSLNPTASNVYTMAGLSAGTYSVRVFDGSCKYGATFNVNPHQFNFSITPPTATLCPGVSAQVAVTFIAPPIVSLGQYTYSWSPTTYLFGGTSQNAIVTPVIPVGTQTSIVYNVMVTPTVINCPITKSFTITAVNPATPTITAIPNLCNTFAPYQITVTPSGGTFNSGITGTNNPISPAGGIINPSLAINGLNTFTYTYSTPIGNCSAKNTATYHVSKFWTASLSSTVPPLCITNAPFNLMNIVQSTVNGSWDSQTPGVVTGGTTFNPAGLPTGNYPITYSTTSSPIASVCPHSTVINVSVTHTSTPNISQVPEFCTNAALINMTVSPLNGGWLPNTNSALSNAGVLNPTLVPVPGMVVTYTAADGPCVNTNTTYLQVSRFYPAGFTGTVANLCFNSNPVNLMSIVQSTINGFWVQSQGVTPTNSFVPSPFIPTGVYTLTYATLSSPNPTLCPDERTIDISVLNPPTPTIQAGAQFGPFCNNASPVQLSVTPNSGQWTASPYLTTTGLFKPSFASVGSNAVQYVIGTSTCNVQDIKSINIEAFVPATIVNQPSDLCNTSSAINLSPFALTNLGVWSGPGVIGGSFSPGNTGSGSFVLTHSTNSSPSGLCPDQATVSVNVYSLAVPAVSQEGPFCNSSLPVQLQVSPVGGLFGGPDVGIVTLAGKFNPASALIGDNVINYSITAGPCVAYAQTVIKVEKFVSASFEKFPGPFCKTDPAVNMNSFAKNPNGEWSQTQGIGLSGSMFNPSQALPGTVNVISYTTHSMPTATLCPDVSTVMIEVRNTPVVRVETTPSGNCAPVEVVFNVPTVNSGEGIWNMGDGSEPVKGFYVSHIFTKPGVYNIQFNYSDGIGCKAEPFLPQPVVVHEVPKADFSFPDEIYISEPQIQLTNLTSILNNNNYQWKVTGMPTKTEVNPILTFSKIGKYQVTLVATSVHDCKDEITKTVEVKNNFNVFIPNSFSPNFDGLNDYFIPVFSKEGLDMKSFEMEIFDRWGHSLFHTKDALGKGWDGSVQNKGEALKEEVYVYRIKYKDLDGNAYNKMGHVSLVK